MGLYNSDDSIPLKPTIIKAKQVTVLKAGTGLTVVWTLLLLRASHVSPGYVRHFFALDSPEALNTRLNFDVGLDILI